MRADHTEIDRSGHTLITATVQVFTGLQMLTTLSCLVWLASLRLLNLDRTSLIRDRFGVPRCIPTALGRCLLNDL